MENQHLGLPVLYRVRARNHYRALGYTKDYFWAHCADLHRGASRPLPLR